MARAWMCLVGRRQEIGPEAAKVPFLGQIPMDPSVRVGGDRVRLSSFLIPDSASAQALRALAELVAASLSVSALARRWRRFDQYGWIIHW
jgi:hypothetical protein